jgi:hypothetical protein
MVRMILTAGDNVQTGRENTLHFGYDASAFMRQSLRGSDMAQNDTLTAGVVTAIMSVQNIAPRLDLKVLVGGIVFLAVAALTDGVLTLAVIVLSGFRIRPVRG